MKNWIRRNAVKVMLGFAAILTATSCLADALITIEGGMATGGGGAVVCRDSQHRVLSAELYDRFEAVFRYGLPQVNPDDPASVTLGRVLSSLGPDSFVAHGIASRIQQSLQKTIWVPTGYKLKAPEDLGRGWGIRLPAGCELEAAAYFNMDGSIEISIDVYSKLSQTDRAALFFHEGLYWMGRDFRPLTESLEVRAITGMAFSVAADSKNWEARALRLISESITKQDGFMRLLVAASDKALPIFARISMVGAPYFRHSQIHVSGHEKQSSSRAQIRTVEIKSNESFEGLVVESADDFGTISFQPNFSFSPLERETKFVVELTYAGTKHQFEIGAHVDTFRLQHLQLQTRSSFDFQLPN